MQRPILIITGTIALVECSGKIKALDYHLKERDGKLVESQIQNLGIIDQVKATKNQGQSQEKANKLLRNNCYLLCLLGAISIQCSHMNRLIMHVFYENKFQWSLSDLCGDEEKSGNSLLIGYQTSLVAFQCSLISENMLFSILQS